MNTRFTRTWVCTIAAALTGALVAATQQPSKPQSQPPSQPPQSGKAADAGPAQKKEFAYAVGFAIGKQVREGLHEDGVDADLDLIARGFGDGLNARDPMFSAADMDDLLVQVHDEMQKRMVKRMLETDPNFRKVHDENSSRSKSYLASHASDAGVNVLPDGIQYKVATQGKGPKPGLKDTVVLNFRGTLIDGTEFSSGQNAEIQVDSTLKAGQEILPMMTAGSHWTVVVPPDMGYGEFGHPPLVGPNQLLIFDLELVAVK